MKLSMSACIYNLIILLSVSDVFLDNKMYVQVFIGVRATPAIAPKSYPLNIKWGLPLLGASKFTSTLAIVLNSKF
jgi:hypothetical protein